MCAAMMRLHNRRCRGRKQYNRLTTDRLLSKEDELMARRTRPVSWRQFRRRYEAEHVATLAPCTRANIGSALNWMERILAPKQLSDLSPASIQVYGRILNTDCGTK